MSASAAAGARRRAAGGADALADGPLGQSVALAFRLLFVVVGLLALLWVGSGFREIRPDQRAAVLRLGRVASVHGPGLLLAAPAPIDRVVTLPAAGVLLALPIRPVNVGYATDETDLELESNDDVVHLRGDRDLDNAAYLLTGDGNVVALDATVFYAVTDPAAFVLTRPAVEPALRRVFRASAVGLAAAHRLDDFLVVAGSGRGGDTRDRVRVALADAMNRRLDRLGPGGAGLGVAVRRIDLVALLPPRAKSAFDAVLTASQIADQSIAAAQTDVTERRAEADRARDRVLAEASAASDERVRDAAVRTAPVASLAAALRSAPNAGARAALLLDSWRRGVAPVLASAGRVDAVAPDLAGRTLLPGGSP